MNTSKQLTFVSLFAGAGGFCLGFKKAGFKPLLATDVDADAEKTFHKNWPDVPFLLRDVRQLDAAEILKATNRVRPDLVIGGPPCQGFSTLGDKLSADPRNSLFDAFSRLVADMKPKCIVIENVKALATMYGGRYKDLILERFTHLGYRMFFKVVNTADYGVPQFRQRIIFFGTLSNLPFAFPSASHGLKRKHPYVTVGEAISDLAKKSTNGIQNHLALEHSDRVIARYRLIPEGGKLPPPELLPVEIRRKNFGNTYKRLDRNKPALTMVPGNNAFPIHPFLHRSLTPREAARIQSFPDSHVFMGERRKQCILVGNAVPPLLAFALAKSVKKHLIGETPVQHSELPFKTAAHEIGFQRTTAERVISLPLVENLSDEHGFVDLFCGAGGFTIGVTRAGFKPLLGADLNENVADTHKSNFPSIPFVQGDLSSPEIREQVLDRLKGKKIALLVGGPPCQGFSIFGNRRFVNTRNYETDTDVRNNLVFSYLEYVAELRPRWFVMENVPGLCSMSEGQVLKVLLEEAKTLGYECEARVLNCADYGIPQLRRRVIILGNRTGHILPWPKKKFFATPEEWQKPYRTVGEAISDLWTTESHNRFKNHVPMNHKALLVERYKFIPEGGTLNLDSLPKYLHKGYRTDQVKNFSHVFKRLHRGRPSITMVPGHNALPIHPFLNRALTVREAARIQTFPDELEFKGSRQEQCIQVGNGFPPLMAELIANNIRKAEKNEWFPGNVPASALYSVIEPAGLALVANSP